MEENVEAILRELLNQKTEQPLSRIKREAGENCLREPKLDEVNNNHFAAAAGLSLHLESIGRDLKSVKDEAVEITTENEAYQPSP